MEYYVKFINKTPIAWTMGVYQELPKSPGLISVAWKQTSAARGTSSSVKWKVNYGLSLNSYLQVGAKSFYVEEQYHSAKPGDRWNVITEGDTQKLVKVDSYGPQNRILVKNLVNDYSNIGIGIDNKTIAVKEDVLNNENASFVVDTEYYVGLFTNLAEGEVIDYNAYVRPEKLSFNENQNMAIVTARLQGKNIVMDVEYSNILDDKSNMFFDYLPANELYTGQLSFKTGRGVTCNNVVNFSKDILRNAENFCKDLTTIINKEGYVANYLKTSNGYHLTEGNMMHKHGIVDECILNSNITITTENLHVLLKSLNSYFEKNIFNTNIKAVNAEYRNGCFMLTLVHTKELEPSTIARKQEALCV